MLKETALADPLLSNFSHPSLMAVVLSAPTRWFASERRYFKATCGLSASMVDCTYTALKLTGTKAVQKYLQYKHRTQSAYIMDQNVICFFIKK